MGCFGSAVGGIRGALPLSYTVVTFSEMMSNILGDVSSHFPVALAIVRDCL